MTYCDYFLYNLTAARVHQTMGKIGLEIETVIVTTAMSCVVSEINSEMQIVVEYPNFFHTPLRNNHRETAADIFEVFFFTTEL